LSFPNLPSKIHKIFKGEVNESMGDERRPERFSPIGNISEPQSHGDTHQYLYFRFSDMEKHKGNHLYEYTGFFKPFLKPEQEKTTKYILPEKKKGNHLSEKTVVIERFSIILAYCRKKRADIQYRDSDDHRYSYIKTP